jgi:hypothetical protein
MSRIAIVNSCKFSSDARVLQVIADFMDEKSFDDIDYLGNGVWEVVADEGTYILNVTGSSEVGNVKIKVTCELNNIED